jgi:DNA-directed RNA polymerase specialized sigma24 family protein
MPPPPLEDLARLALDGDRDAVERLVRALQTDVYGLALRMLWNREDAEDATQEILVRAVTRIAKARPKALSTPTTFPKTRRRASLPSA